MKHIVITTINPPNFATRELARGAAAQGWQFVVIGDRKSPPGYDLAHARFYSLDEQRALPFDYAAKCPPGHYARKNIGYLVAMQEGAQEILETDDDNIPRDAFFAARDAEQPARICDRPGWLNVYAYFSDAVVWPRGFPLDRVRAVQPALTSMKSERRRFAVHQGLADENPDVDAVYRLLFPLPLNFKQGESVAISGEANCPFNSQNTRWWPEAYPLLYLPFHCSFRMTDIWRSFVAQRILAAQGGGVVFHDATVYQDRNEHDLMRDFRDEIEGYCTNARIMEMLNALPLAGTAASVFDDMAQCYECLIGLGVVKPEERELLAAWRADCERIAAVGGGE